MWLYPHLGAHRAGAAAYLKQPWTVFFIKKKSPIYSERTQGSMWYQEACSRLIIANWIRAKIRKKIS
jgi:hypothetical protein